MSLTHTVVACRGMRKSLWQRSHCFACRWFTDPCSPSIPLPLQLYDSNSPFTTNSESTHHLLTPDKFFPSWQYKLRPPRCVIQYGSAWIWRYSFYLSPSWCPYLSQKHMFFFVGMLDCQGAFLSLDSHPTGVSTFLVHTGCCSLWISLRLRCPRLLPWQFYLHILVLSISPAVFSPPVFLGVLGFLS